MKRRIFILLLALVFVCSAIALTACKDDSLDKAKTQLESVYSADSAKAKFESGEDYNLVGSIEVDGKNYSITWTANVNNVTITKGDDGNVSVAVVKGDAAVNYVLTATIADENNNTVTATFNGKIPANAPANDKTDLTPVADALKAKYATNNFSGGSNFNVAAGIEVAGVTYAITWQSNKTNVVIGAKSGENYPVTVTKLDDAVTYKLVATIVDPADASNKKAVTFDNLTVPAKPQGGDDPIVVNNDGSAEHPYTPAEAVALIKAWDSGKTTSDNPVYVKGTVTGTVTESTKNANTWWFDLEGASDNLVIYYAKTATKPAEGDELLVYGYLKLFVDSNDSTKIKYEMDNVNNILLVVVSINGEPTGEVAGTTIAPVTDDDAKGGKNNPYSVAEAIAAANALAKDAYTDKMVYAVGYVTSAEYSTQYGNWAIRIADKAGNATDLLCHRTALGSGVTTVAVGDKITIYGYLQNYYGNTPEFTFNNNMAPTVVAVLETGNATVRGAAANENCTITFTPAAAGDGVVYGHKNDTVTFTVAVDNGYDLISVSAGATPLTDVDGVYTVTLDGNIIINVSTTLHGQEAKGTESNPYNVAQASAAAPAQGSYSAVVWVKGTVVGGAQAAKPTVGSGGQVIFYIADTAEGTGMQIRYANLANGVNAIGLGDVVIVKGLLTQYSNAAQMAKDSSVTGSDPEVVSVESRANGSIEAASSNENSTIAFVGSSEIKITAENGTEVKFTVTPASGYENPVVKVNDKTIEASDSVYSVYLSGDMTIVVTVSEVGVAAKGTAGNPYTVSEAREIADNLPGKAQSKSVYNDAVVYVIGYVVNITSQTNFEIAETKGGSPVFGFYNGEKDTDVADKTIYIGDEVLICGYIANYSNSYKLQLATNNSVKPLVKEIETADATIKAAASNNENAVITFTSGTPVDGVVTGKNGSTVTFTIAAEGYTITSVKVGDVDLTGKDADGVYTATLNGDQDIMVAIKSNDSTEKTVTLDYTGTTGNMATGNNAEKVGLDATIFTISSDKGSGSNQIGTNADGTLRLYYGSGGNGCTLTIAVAEGYTIKSITIKAKAAKETVLMKVGDAEATQLNTNYSNTVVTVNASSITIKNVNTTNVQIYIDSIEIVYDVA